jgi:CheY-like chemotaxis protein
MSGGTRERVVLVVDDDEDIRESLRELLEEEGFRVETAADGQEALERLHSIPVPCLIFLDLMMPVMDGFRFKEALDCDPRFADVPVAIMTAGKTPAPPNVLAVLRKPMIIEAVLRTAKELC